MTTRMDPTTGPGSTVAADPGSAAGRTPGPVQGPDPTVRTRVDPGPDPHPGPVVAYTHPGPDPDPDDVWTPKDWKIGAVLAVVGVALTAVIAAPIMLSSQDLYRWAVDPQGLAMAAPWAHGVYLALDLAALVCIGMTLVAAWRRERATVFALLVWVFAGTSAFAQYQHGDKLLKAGGAQDAWWAMPAFALLGPLLLEVVMHTVRRWLKKDAGDHVSPMRWIVAFRETRQAWVLRVRDNITLAAALRRVRDAKLIAGLDHADAIVFAQSATRSADPYRLRVWLADRGVTVTLNDLESAADRRVRVELDTRTHGSGPTAEHPDPAVDPRVDPGLDPAVDPGLDPGPAHRTPARTPASRAGSGARVRPGPGPGPRGSGPRRTPDPDPVDLAEKMAEHADEIRIVQAFLGDRWFEKTFPSGNALYDMEIPGIRKKSRCAPIAKCLDRLAADERAERAAATTT